MTMLQRSLLPDDAAPTSDLHGLPTQPHDAHLPAGQGTSVAGRSSARRPLRVMIVEDEAVVAIDLECRLQALGYDVVGIADTLTDAVALFAKTLPDLVLLDIRLRDREDGIEVARALRARADRPIVFISAYNDPTTVRRATGVGPHGYLIKPFDDRMLVVTVAIALERHAAERTLRIYRAALHSAHIGVLLVSRRGDEPRIAYANAEYLHMAGRSLEEVLSAPPCVLAVDREGEDARALREAIATGGRDRREVLCQRADGTRFWVSAVVSPVEGQAPEEPMTMVFLLDVTREREARNALGASQRMEVAGRLAAAVAHDFNNVMTAIGSFAELALEADNLAQCRDDLREVLRANWTGARLMEKLLQVARPPRAEQGVAADIAQVLASARPTLERLVGSGIALQMRLGADSLVVGLGITCIEQVIFNLAANARDAMPDGGTLRIELARLPDEGAPTRALLRFCDTGVGMGADTLARIFDPFFTTKPAGLGTGLGLPTARALVEAAGGAVRARSEPGVGTDFEVELPLVATKPEFVDETESLGAMLHRAGGELCALILPVGPVRRAYARGLSLVGLQVRELSDPEEVTRALGAEVHDVRVAVVEVSALGDGAAQESVLARLRERLPTAALLVVGGLDAARVPPGVRSLRRPCSTAHLARAALDELSVALPTTHPSTYPAAPPPMVPPRDEVPREAPSVLLVDDDVPLSHALGRALRREGYRVRTAGSCEEAQSLLASAPVDLLITDVQLGSRNGLDLLALSARDHLAVPVLVISAGLSQPDVQRAIEGQVAGFLPKPFDIDTFKLAVRHALDEGRTARLQRALLRSRIPAKLLEDLSDTRQRFEASLRTLSLRLLPIVPCAGGETFGWEADPCSHGPFADAATLLAAAEALGEVERYGAAVRAALVATAASGPAPRGPLFVQLHPWQLLTQHLAHDAPFLALAPRVVLTVSERAQLASIGQVEARLATLRLNGFRVALRNLGEGYASVGWMQKLRPEFAIVDAPLVHLIDQDEARRELVETLLRICRRSRTRLIAEGVERLAERDALRALGCELMRESAPSPSRREPLSGPPPPGGR
jgi:two-component system cell cycle sensor histidine kinase/response regulator CckA